MKWAFMNQKKKIVVTVWISTLILFLLGLFLPAKADRYFLSTRILSNETALIQMQATQKKTGFEFLRGPADDERVIKMLAKNQQEDKNALIVYLGIILIVLNVMACLLYIFNMQSIKIVGLILIYVVLFVLILVQSFVRISPGHLM